MKTTIVNKSIFIIIGLSFLFSSSGAQNYRYVNTVFDASAKTRGVVFGNAAFLDFPYIDESAVINQDLVMDIYQPHRDELSNRPAIIFAHGGGFITGERTADDMVAFCDSFARKGYVAVTIDYRQGVEVFDNPDMHYTRAAYRGVQDGRAAVRFLRANAAAYGIDPDHIYWGGNSAGSFIGLNMIYLDSDEIPEYTGNVNYSVLIASYNGPDLGNLDIGNNLSYSGKPNGVMACWGGVSDTLYIEADNKTPVFLVHGTADNVVPFNSGAPFNINGLSAVYGSSSIHARLNNLGIPAEQTYFVPNAGHGFYGVINGEWIDGNGGNAYWDTIVGKATKFYWQLHKPTAGYTYTVDELTIDFTDTSKDATSWFWDFGDGNTSTEQNPNHTFPVQGTYNVKLYIENNMHSWDTIVHDVSVSGTGIDKTVTDNPAVVYPNPSGDWVRLVFTTPIKKATVQLYSIHGKLINTRSNQQGRQVFFDLSDLEKGMYLIRINSDKKETQVNIIKN